MSSKSCNNEQSNKNDEYFQCNAGFQQTRFDCGISPDSFKSV